MIYRKGSPRHAVAGKFFVASMLVMAAAAVYLAILKHQTNNIGGGILVRGGVLGAKRIRRHLWRMCFGWFIATGSFFLGQQQVFPAFLRGSAVLLILGVLPLFLLIFWIFRLRFAKAYRMWGVRSAAGAA